MTVKSEPKKRGRKAKKTTESTTPSVPKKRGRKPKGGKIIENTKVVVTEPPQKPNVILHLKCNSKDINVSLDHEFIQNNTNNNGGIQSYNFDSTNKNNDLQYQIIKNPENKSIKEDNSISDVSDDDNSNFNYKLLNQKLKELQYNLKNNNISDKKSACFWCTYEFDNLPIYIPKYEINNNYNVYGCFCSPECATAYLMQENIDDSSKFERYHFLNHIYSKIYNYKKNIKPAPNPYYTLDKFYGNLTITEYRKLLCNDRILFVVDKPMTRILPELHDDNDEFMINKKPSKTFKVRRSKKPNKNTILTENFGLTT